MNPAQHLTYSIVKTSLAAALLGPIAQSASELFVLGQAEGTGVLVEARDELAWTTLRDARGDLRISGFPLDSATQVDLEMRRFVVVSENTRFVLGAEARPIDFDPASVTLLRGSVAGHPGSRAFLALSAHGSLGYVDLGETGESYEVSGLAGEQPLLHVRPVLASAGGWSLPVAACGVGRNGASSGSPRPVPPQRGFVGASGVKHIELAIETDYEYYQLFGDLQAASAYIVALYGAVSDIYVRDVNAWVELTFVRLWDDPADLFNEESPIVPFRDYWEANMGAVQRDTAQFLSGRRDLPWGGIAWVSALCSDFGYSVCGYALGFYTDPNRPAIGNRDITVTAHELGHNCAAFHTHDYGLDTCNDENSAPQRGTIMSYCGQTFTGGEANMEARFHTVVQDVIEDFLEQSTTCIDDDCNQNAVSDAQDLRAGKQL